MTTASTQRSRLRATSATGSRRPSATSGCSADDVPAELADGDLEGRPRAQRRLFEQHRDMAARRAPSAVGASAAERPVGLHLRREVETALEVGGVEVEDRQEILAGGVQLMAWRQVRYSALIRTYSALRSHVQTVDDARAGAEIDRDDDVACPSGTRPLPARASSCGRPSLEEHGRPDRDRRARQLEGDAGAPGDGNQPAPVRIAAVDRGLDEQRVGDRLGGAPRLGRRRRAGDV